MKENAFSRACQAWELFHICPVVSLLSSKCFALVKTTEINDRAVIFHSITAPLIDQEVLTNQS